MPDDFTKAKRSEVMSRIRGRGNKDTELALAKLLRAHGFTGWRRHVEIRGGGKAAALRRPRTSQRNVPTSQKRAARQHRPTERTAQRSVPTFRVKPDFVFTRLRLALFVDGCFWHGCPKHCKYAKWLTPSVLNNPPSPRNRLRRTGRAFWRRKLAANKERDQRVNRVLRRAGWRVLRVWECDLAKRPEICVPRIEKTLKL